MTADVKREAYRGQPPSPATKHLPTIVSGSAILVWQQQEALLVWLIALLFPMNMLHINLHQGLPSIEAVQL